MAELREYGVATTFLMPVIKAGAVDFATSSDWTPAAGDVKVIKNEGTPANIGTLPTAVGNMWKFTLTATEMQAARVDIQVVDSATKAVEDQAYKFTTYGHASAQHETFPSDLQSVGGSDATAIAELTGVPSATPSLLVAVMGPFMTWRNKLVSNSTTGETEIYNSAGTKILEKPFTDLSSIFTSEKVETPD
jgi:hypothetical protein